MENQEKTNWHDKSYKLLLLLPLAIILFSIIYLFMFYNTNGDIFKKDITLTGGTSITIYDKISLSELTSSLEGKLIDLNVRETSDLFTGEQTSLIIETTSSDTEAKQLIEEILGYELTEENSSFTFTGASLSKSVYKQLLLAILVAFVFMAIVVFLIFKDLVPSGAVVLSAFANILMTLVVVDLVGIKMSTAGIIAFLMLIGYSVDTDILLTSRVLKRSDGTVNERLAGALKTGLTMTLTSFFAMLVALFVVKSFSVVLTQIFTILVIGLFFDMFNTWITNASLLKWYVLRKRK
jgi:preprotein translocase subunit SecF